jgi:hypothetical protein
VRAAALSVSGGEVVWERSGDGEDAGDDVRDDGVCGGVVVTVALAPGGFAAVEVAVPLA